ncbi:MAG: TRAP transporter small permease [Alkalilacustris sp.]
MAARIFSIIDRAALGLCCTLLCAMVALIATQITTRYAIGSTLPWTEEVARHLMIWMLFLGIAPAYRRGAHLGLDLWPARMGERGRAVAGTLVLLLVAGFAVAMLRHGLDLSSRTMRQRASGLGYPMGYVYAAVPVGGALLLVHIASTLPDVLRRALGREPAPEGRA